MSGRGFSLVEVILALAVAALVMAALVPALVGALHAERQARATLAPLAEEPAALAVLRDDLLAAPRPNGSLARPFSIVPGQVDGRRGDTLELLSEVARPLHPTQALRPAEVGQVVVTWGVRRSDDGRGLTWTRKRQANLLATGTLAEPIEEVMLDHLAQVSVEAFSSTGLFLTAYNSDENDSRLPAAVRIGWTPLREDGSPGQARLVVIDLPQMLLDPTQQAGGT
jgi:prepilin-type N-terminal cleavage/methylation domain-containing protein